MELLYITNDVVEYKTIEEAGVDTAFIDLEILGKVERQGDLDTVISRHNIEDVKKIKKVQEKSKILVRIDPMNEKSEEQIEKAIEYGADIIMLPMFTTKEEVEKFSKIVGNRAKKYLLLETAQAFCRIDEILEVEGIDAIHIGLNDLHLSLGLDFMFECFSCGIVEYLTKKIGDKGIKFGIGGVAKIGEGELPAEIILKEHIRLKSEIVILSRSFKKNMEDLAVEVKKIREKIEEYKKLPSRELNENKLILKEKVKKIILAKKEKEKKSV